MVCVSDCASLVTVDDGAAVGSYALGVLRSSSRLVFGAQQKRGSLELLRGRTRLLDLGGARTAGALADAGRD